MNAIPHVSTAPAGPALDNRRMLAAVIDLALIVAGAFVLAFLASAVTGSEGGITPQMRMIMLAWGLYYYFALESGAGQTVGKKLMKIRVMRADGAPAGMREIAIRTVLRVVDGLFVYLVGLIVMLASGERRQRLGDMAAGTVVADAATAPEAVAPAPAVPEAPAAEDAPAELPAESFVPSEAPEAPEAEHFEGDTPSEDREPEQQADVIPLEPAPAPQADEPAPQEPRVELSAVEEPAVEEPAVDEPSVRVAGLEEPSAQEPAVEQPAAEQAAAQEPWAGQPSAEESAAEQPPAVEPEAEEPQAQEPPAEQPAPGADDEHRRQEDERGDDVNVRSVETVSAIDLVMGEDERDESTEHHDGREQ